ncbi:hypothetical protein AQ505_20430 [Pedobacter sp. PACM 27299]|uniref:hypothetical protein n=1 Tax=Pedobacter sp. PACM 27299 TaxID=1727164 RepID=UPI00070646DE|nr:hypothetical protein [Pedobacter sp. PACM 27299]ALL07647.1 hypothetical protein AQ505_20430 [Pedobacter sp. PACM 27299]
MKHFLNYILCFLVLVLSGCGMFRKVSIDQTVDRSEERKIHRLDSTAVIRDQSVIQIKVNADTVVTLAGQEISQASYFQLDSLLNGITAIKNELVDVRLILNPQTQRLTVSAVLNPRHIPIKIQKETLIHKDLHTSVGSSESSFSASEVTKSTSVKLKEPGQIQYWLIAMVVLIIAVTFVFMIGRK